MNKDKQIGCAVILYNNKIVGWRMSRDIDVDNARKIISEKYYHSHKPEDCKIEVKMFEGTDTGGWMLKTDREAEEWRRQWEIDPEYQDLIDKEVAYPPY